MQEKLSIKGNLINYDRNSINQDISEILLNRLPENDIGLNKTLKDLHNPFLLAGMKEAVERIKKAKDNDEKIIIFGDYDVDGVTSTSILMHFFKKIGIKASYRLPDRVKDGYGLKKYFVDEISNLGVSLIITVDCGTKDIDVIKYSKSKNIDVIVTDHHEVPEIIPEEAISIINPKRKDCSYPYKKLSGAGVAFKLVSALAGEILSKDECEKYIKETLDIAAIGTVADCMDLTGENRIIVNYGLKQLKNTRSRGIKELVKDRIDDDLDSDIFSFLVGPKLNSAGRLDSPYKAVNLILNNSDSVEETLDEIEFLNNSRKELTIKHYDLALEKINPSDNIIFYESKDIPHGIIGILAGRLTEKYYRPSIILIEEEDKYVASCRSPEFFSMIELLDKYKKYFIVYGGHKQAAGFSIKKDDFSEFKEKVLKEINKKDFSDFKKTIKIDKIVDINDLGFKFLDKVNKFKPFGLGNPKPLFMIEDFKFKAVNYLGKGRDHLKFITFSGHNIISFFMGDYFDEIKKAKKIDLIFELNINNFNGNRNLQLQVVDLVLE